MDSPISGALVSVVVRTMGRPTLARALGSLAAQAYHPLEIVLVDAAGRGHLDTAAAGGLPVRLVERGALARAAAANAGLEAAAGAWIAFLDDDDLLAPSHVANLVAALDASPGARVAYSQSALLDAAGRPARLLGGPFDRFALFRSNYIAIHAALFSRSLVAEGCRFDERLPMFEDWDFWLQLALRSPFAFVAQPTALYHAAAGESGAGSEGNLDREALLANRARLVAKWGAEQARLQQKARHALERAQALDKAGRSAAAEAYRARARALQHGAIVEPQPH